MYCIAVDVLDQENDFPDDAPDDVPEEWLNWIQGDGKLHGVILSRIPVGNPWLFLTISDKLDKRLVNRGCHFMET